MGKQLWNLKYVEDFYKLSRFSHEEVCEAQFSHENKWEQYAKQ